MKTSLLTLNEHTSNPSKDVNEKFCQYIGKVQFLLTRNVSFKEIISTETKSAGNDQHEKVGCYGTVG